MSMQAIIIYGGLIGGGLFHILLPGVAKALWDYSSQRQEERWEDGDLRGYDPFAPKHHYDASLLSYRLLGVGLIACALIIMWYAR